MTGSTPRRTSGARAAAKHDAAIAEAERLAGLLAAAPADGSGALSPPAFIADPKLAPALAVWRELAPQLARSGRLHSVDRLAFGMLCYWHAEFITAHDDIQRSGFWFMKRAVAGGERPWKNPSVDRRDTAAAQIETLSSRFGLTPLDRIALNRAQRDGHLDEPDLFAAVRAKPADAAAPAPAPTAWDVLLDQSPPVGVPN